MPNHPQATSARINAGRFEPDGAVGGAREDREGDAVLRARVRVEEDGDEDDGVAQQDRDDGLPPAHPHRHEAGGQHVGGDAVGHADPERGVVVGRPVAPGDGDGGQVRVVEGALLDERGRDELHPPVGVPDLAPRAGGRGGGGAHAMRGRPAWRFTNSPRPLRPLSSPWSTITSPRESTDHGGALHGAALVGVVVHLHVVGLRGEGRLLLGVEEHHVAVASRRRWCPSSARGRTSAPGSWR